jgi:hypothetical protein
VIEIAAPSRLMRVDPALFSPRGDGQKRFRRGPAHSRLLERLPEVALPLNAHRRGARVARTRQGVDEAEAEAFAREALGD